MSYSAKSEDVMSFLSCESVEDNSKSDNEIRLRLPACAPTSSPKFSFTYLGRADAAAGPRGARC